MPGAFDFTPEELDELFKDEELPAATATPVKEGSGTTTEQVPAKEVVTPENVETTQAFAKRLNEKTNKAVAEEREAIAKQMGFESYDAMMKSKEEKIYNDSGLDPELVAPVVEKLVEERLKNMPQMKELAEVRAQKVKEYGERELAEITKLTGGKITTFEQLPKDTVELWKQTGSLKSAYLQLHGEELIIAARSEQSRGSTSHMATPDSGSQNTSSKRLLTPEEKEIWKKFFPKMTKEELDKQTIDNDVDKKTQYKY